MTGTAGTVAFTGIDARRGSGQPTHPASMAAANQREDSASSYSGNGENSPQPLGPRISPASRTVTPLNLTRIGMLTIRSPSNRAARSGAVEPVIARPVRQTGWKTGWRCPGTGSGKARG